MSLYKTQRCRHFDEVGNAIKPYCSQGNKCRFIHPNDHQWSKLKRRNDDSPSPQNRDPVRSKGKNKPPVSPPRRRSSPPIPQPDLSKRKQRDPPRDHDHREWFRDPRRESDSWGAARERGGPVDQGYSLKRASNEDHRYPNQRPRLSDTTLYRSTSGSGSNNAHHPVQTDKILRIPEYESKPMTNVSDTFHRLAKLCCEIVQDTCFLDREQDKLKAFTGLSSELSRAVPDAAMAATPALATVINGHTRTRERLESHVEELETLWRTLFSVLESDISKIIDSRLEQAISLLDKGRDNALRVIAQQKPDNDKLYDGKGGPRHRTDDPKDVVANKNIASQWNSNPMKSGTTVNVSPDQMRLHEGTTSLSLAPTNEVDLGASIRIVLEDMKMQMDRQTKAIELLAKENLQLRSASEHAYPLDSDSSSPRKPSIF